MAGRRPDKSSQGLETLERMNLHIFRQGSQNSFIQVKTAHPMEVHQLDILNNL